MSMLAFTDRNELVVSGLEISQVFLYKEHDLARIAYFVRITNENKGSGRALLQQLAASSFYKAGLLLHIYGSMFF